MAHDLGPSETGSVVVDIGGDFGAAIVHTTAIPTGAEIEIRRAGTPWKGEHSAIRARHLAEGVVYAALFGSLREGSYEVRVRGGGPAAPATAMRVAASRVVEVHLSA